jgi:hypothetical protein
MARHSVWELVFFLVILKVPIVYLAAVVYHAIKAEPFPEQGEAVAARPDTDDSGPGRGPRLQRHRNRPRPHGGPARTYARVPRAALAQAEAHRR